MANQREILAAIAERYSTFTQTGAPPRLWEGIPPTKNTDGTATTIPLGAIFDDLAGDMPTTFEHMYEEVPNIRIEIFAASKASAISIVQLILFNGGAPNAGAGMHYADSLPFTSAMVFMQMHLVGKPIYKELIDRSNTSSRVWQATLRFFVQVRQVS